LIPDSQTDLLYDIRMLEKAKHRKRPKKTWIPILTGLVLLLVFNRNNINNYLHIP